MPELPFQTLTAREVEVLNLVAAGASGKEIAQKLSIATRTVEAHIDHLKLKMQAKNRAHLVAIALKAGLINPPDRLTQSNDGSRS